MSVPNYFNILFMYFNDHKHEYNFTFKRDCGIFTEKSLIHLREITGDFRFKHLRKYGGATQYNKHAIDVWAFDNRGNNDGTPIMEIDILEAAESDDQINKPTKVSWQVRETPYEAKDLMEPEEIGQDEPIPINMVPWVVYNEQGFERLKKMLKHDYERRPQSADFDVSVWAGRYFHNQYMGPNKIPLGENEALKRVKGELCIALGISNDGYLGE